MAYNATFSVIDNYSPEIVIDNYSPEVLNNDALSTILATLIKNIESKKDGRWTSGVHSEKVKQLHELKKTLLADKTGIKAGSPEEVNYVSKIMAICQIKRNPIHFWAAPESVGEYKALLKQHNINLPSEFSGQACKIG